MIDRVSNPVQGQNQLGTERNRGAQGNESAREGGRNDGTRGETPRADADRVSISESSRVLQTLEQRVADSEGVDRERVEAIRESIANGDFEADPSRIADALISSERDQ